MTQARENEIHLTFAAVKAAIVLIAVVGFSVVLGWHIRSKFLIQWSPSFPPMPYHAGWGFLLCSFGLICLLKKWLLPSCLCGISLIVFAISSIILDASSHHLTVSICRIAGFFISGVVLFLFSRDPRDLRKANIAGFLGLLVLFVGLLVIASFLIAPSVEIDSMSIHGAIAFFIFGIAVVDLAWPEKSVPSALASHLFPWAVASAIFMASLGLYRTLKLDDAEKFSHNVSMELSEAALEMKRGMENRIESIVRFAHHWAIWGKPKREVWESDALEYVRGHQAYQSIGWVDSSYHLRWLVPLKGNEPSMNLDLRFEPRRFAAFQKAYNERKTTITRPLNLVEGGSGFRVVVPIFHGEDFEGFIVSAFRYRPLFDLILHDDIARDYGVDIFDGEEQVYSRNVLPVQDSTLEWMQRRFIDLAGEKWAVQIWPSHKVVAARTSLLPRGIFIIGSLIATATGLFIFVIQVSWRRKTDTEANRRLAAQLTERSKMERRLKAILESTPDVMLVFNQQNVIVSVNSQAERVLRCSRHILLGRSVSDFINYEPLDQKVAVNDSSPCVSSAPDTQVCRHDGSHFSAQVTCSFLELDEETLGIASIRDITSRKQQEEDLARSNEELERFAYVASHDLQEPLRMVVSYLDLLSRRYRSKLDREADEFIGYAVDGAKRMKQLIEDLLTLSRVSPSRYKLTTATSLKDSFENALFNLNVSVRESGAIVTSDDLPAVPGDSFQLTQLFQNLIGNAIKYRKPNETPRIHLSVVEDVDHWSFSLKDNGIGFLRAYAEKIFVVFQRLHSRDKYSGNGVGLAICKRIVERHGGIIRAEAEPGEGATFFFNLPKALS